MTTPNANNIYSQTTGSTSSAVFINVFMDRDPTPYDFNYPCQKRWVNTVTKGEWILKSFISTPTATLANWISLSTGGTGDVETLTGNTGGAVGPDNNGNINTIGDGTSITVAGDPGTYTLTASVIAGKFDETLTGNSGGAVHADSSGNINVLGDTSSIFITGDPGTHTLTANALLPPEYWTLCSGGTTPANFVGVNPGTMGQVLTSQGNAAYPVYQNITVATAISVNQIVITTSGIYTPSANMQYCIVEITGGGGGGAGCSPTNASQISCAGGGGGGGYCESIFSAADIGASQAFIIGTGGAGGGSSGTDGTATTFMTMTANGGTFGDSLGPSVAGCAQNGLGGTATGGQINLNGQSGLIGMGFSSTGNFGDSMGGAGGSCILGTGGQGSGGTGSTTINGGNGNNYGGGGGGAAAGYSSGLGGSGGAGAPGVCIITEYIQSSTPISGVLSINEVVITSSGNYTPSVGLQYAIVECQAGGGAGSSTSTTNSTQVSVGGGGGAGEYRKGNFSAAAIGASQAVTIGTGGTSPSVPAGNTVFGSLITSVGAASLGTAPTSDNVASGNGGVGASGGSGGSYGNPGGGGGAAFGANVAGPGDATMSGAGGASYFGSGGAGIGGGTAAGLSGSAWGSGGGGAISTNSSAGQVGGPGAQGIVIITEYIVT